MEKRYPMSAPIKRKLKWLYKYQKIDKRVASEIKKKKGNFIIIIKGSINQEAMKNAKQLCT